MDEILKLQAKIAEAAKSMRTLIDAARTEDRALTDEERGKLDTVKADIARWQRQIELQKEQERIEAELASSTRQVPGSNAAAGLDPAKAGPDNGKAPAQRVQVRDRSDYSVEIQFGEMLRHVRDAATGRGVSAWLENHQKEARAAQGLTSVTGADGGFLVSTAVSQTIFQRMNKMGQILQRCDKLPPLDGNADSIEIPAVAETSRATGSRWGGVQGYWVGDATAPTPTKPKFKKMTLKPQGLACLGYATDKLLKHAAIAGQIMLKAFSEELTVLTEGAIYRGTGAGQPHGIIGAAGVVEVAKENNQAAATITIQNVVKMWSRCHADHRPNAAWFINQDIEPQLFLMSLAVGTGGVPVYMPAGALSGSPFATLFGRPVVPIEHASTLGTVGDIVLADFDAYALLDLGQPESASSMHVAFTTFEEAFRVIYYVDGQLKWHSALTPLNGNNTLSPVVTLATRS